MSNFAKKHPVYATNISDDFSTARSAPNIGSDRFGSIPDDFWEDDNRQQFSQAILALEVDYLATLGLSHLFIFVFRVLTNLEPVCPLFWWLNRPSKGRPFPIKTRVIWVPGKYTLQKFPRTQLEILAFGYWRNAMLTSLNHGFSSRHDRFPEG